MSNFNNFFQDGFDAKKAVEENQSEGVRLPEGDYKMYVDSYLEVNRPEKNQAGVVFTYIVMSGQYEGSVVRDQFLFLQDNEKGIQASLGGFGQLALACGKENLGSFDELVGKTIFVNMKNSKDGKYCNPNKRSAFTGQSSTPTAQAQPATAAPETGAKKMPWAK